jgi:hypothetical protein
MMRIRRRATTNEARLLDDEPEVVAVAKGGAARDGQARFYRFLGHHLTEPAYRGCRLRGRSVTSLCDSAASFVAAPLSSVANLARSSSSMCLASAELNNLSSAEEAAIWAHRVLGDKNRLTATAS